MASPDENGDAICESNCVFSFCDKDFEFDADPWLADDNAFHLSKFDVKLQQAWDNACSVGAFWYDLSNVERKKITGTFGLYAQLNTKRFAQRRKPEESTKVVMPFNDAKFNFTKIKEKEVLFTMKDNDSENREANHKLIINVSPIEYGHVLLVPNVDMKLPQTLDKEAVKLAAQVCLLSKHRGLRLGFNSLCALASVNHQHLHAFYINHQLPIDKVKFQERKGGLLILENYMVRGYAVQLDEDVDFFASQVSLITDYFCQNNIAHNLFMCRGRRASSAQNMPRDGSTITAFIFPKHPCSAITDHPFNVAFLELGGFLPIRDKDQYDSITEDQAVKLLNRYTFREEEFDQLTHKLTDLLKQMLPS